MIHSQADSAKSNRIILGGIAGNVMEWYDFALYGYFAAIIGKQFFPSDDPTVSTIAAFGAFAAGFLARPIGGLVLGRIGDSLGRRAVLMISVLCMAVPTMLMGLLPSHEHIGVAAPIMVVLLRIIQGLSVGGEYTSSAVFLAEHAPSGRRGLIASWSAWGATAGMLLGSGTGVALTAFLEPAQLEAWGWRLPFVGGVAIAAVSLVLRRGLDEEEPPRQTVSPIASAFRDHWSDMLRIVGMNIGLGVAFYMVFVYSVTYIVEIDKLSEHTAFDLNTITMTVLLCTVPAGAWLSDLFGRKRLLLAATGALAVLSVPTFSLIHSTEPLTVFLGQLLFAVLIGLYAGPICAANAEQLPRHVRCTGLAMAYNLSIGLFGGTTPMVATWLIRETGDPIAPAYYLTAACAVSLLAIVCLRETADAPLEGGTETHPLPPAASTVVKLVSVLLLGTTVAQGDALTGRQCPNFATTEQPYLYLYTSEKYEGSPLYVTNVSVPDLAYVRAGVSYTSYYDDKASSLRLRGKWRICTRSTYSGKCVDVSSSSSKSELAIKSLATKFGGEYDDAFSSIRLLSCGEY